MFQFALSAFPAVIALEVQEAIRHLQRERTMALWDLHPPADAPIPRPQQQKKPIDVGFDPTDPALRAAARMWESVIEEPPGHGWELIDDMIRGPKGLGWASAALPDSGDTDKYTEDGQFQWCGAAAARALFEAGLKKDIRKRVMASCYRLHTFTKGTPRMLPPDQVRAGDVLVVGPQKIKRGTHIGICAETPRPGAASIETFEGNAWGRGPWNRRYQGFVRNTRPFFHAQPEKYRALYVVRFLPEDFDTAGKAA